MKGTGGVSKEYLERRVLALEEENAALHSEIEDLRAAIERRDRATERLEKLLKHYTNPNTPPSANSLEWKEEKRQRRGERRGGDAPATGKRGGQAGHPGVSRRHAPGEGRKAQVQAQEGGPEARAGRLVRVRGAHGGRHQARARHYGDQDNV